MRAYALFLIALALIAATAAMPSSANADEEFSVVINGRTGEAFLRNDSATALDIDGYLLLSPRVDVFDPDSWDSLQNNPATPGWLESLATGNRLGEGSLFGSATVGPGATLGIGSPYMPFAPAAIGQPEPGVGSIDFTYSLASGGALTGDVEFISRNTVVLVVDPESGAASLENQSALDVNIDSYLIQSVPNVLDVAGWTPLAESLGVPGGWRASTGEANRIAEGNLFGSTFLAANGGSLPIGTPIDPELLDDETDLVLEFSVTGVGSILGGVLFAAVAPALPGDYNGNGIVDAADFTVWRDRLGQQTALPNTDPTDIDGVVTVAEYNFWKSRFGMTSGGGAGSLGPSTGAVPEPATCLLACMAAIALGCVGRPPRAG